MQCRIRGETKALEDRVLEDRVPGGKVLEDKAPEDYAVLSKQNHLIITISLSIPSRAGPRALILVPATNNHWTTLCKILPADPWKATSTNIQRVVK